VRKTHGAEKRLSSVKRLLSKKGPEEDVEWKHRNIFIKKLKKNL